MYNINGIEDLVRTCNDMEDFSSGERSEIARVLRNILGHVDDFVTKHGYETGDYEKSYILSFEEITEDAVEAFANILYELEEYILR